VRDPAREWVEDLVSAWDLIDIKPAKGLYTWTNKRIGPGHIAARLDRFLVQSSFLLLGLTATVEILPHSVSNHKPIRLGIKTDQVRGPIPFKFNLTWIQDKDFLPLVSKTWTSIVKGSSFYVWEEKLRRLKIALKFWAKGQPNPITLRIEAQTQLENLQLEMENKEITQEGLQQEDRLQRQWHRACREEESYWRQKSRSLWLKEGDKNTSYFHKQAEARKHYKAVTEIQVQNETIADPEGIKQAAFEAFEALYSEPQGTVIDPQMYPLSIIPVLIKEDINTKLTKELLQQEIKEALDQMNPDKAPGPDGFTARFYQQCWEIIKTDLTKMIRKSQQSSKLGGSTNLAFLALIPKEKGAITFNRFRPISLCNTSYKILTKVIANRLKTILPLIVPENQGGFIQGRHIADNIILVQEALHSSVRRKDKGMIIKLDLANAFDRVRHRFLFEVMRKFGFDPSFVNWIKACIGSPWITPMVNGKVTKFFQASRGLRQGCPLSPLLYAIQASVLSYQLENSQVQNNLQGLRIAQGVKDINHAQFADDTLLLGGVSPIIAKKFKEELEAYAAVSGSEISQTKRKIYGWNITPNEMLGITRVLGMEGHTNWEAFKYLGIPIFKSAPRASHWNHLIDNLKNKISSWGANWLNLAGKVVLIKAVLTSIPIYQSSFLLAPASVIQKIEALQRRFLWEGGKQSRRKMHLINWEKTSKPLLEGGLNFKKTQAQNLALGAKLLWTMVTGKPTWSKLALWKKYFRGPRDRCLDFPCRESKGSPIFTLCKKALPHFSPHLTWVPRNGKKIKIWQDSIMGDPPLGLRQDLLRLKDWMESQNIITLFDISTWGEDKFMTWQGWGVLNRPPDLEREWSTLQLCLQGKAPLKKKGKDERGWGRNAKAYTTAEGYHLITNVPNVLPNPTIWRAIWQSKSIPKIDLFIWTLAHNSIQTGENLKRRGWEGPYRCPFCLHAEETTDHLLLNCEYSKEVWKLATGTQSAISLPPDTRSLLHQWDSYYPFKTKKRSQAFALWKVLPKFILWNLWLERNNRIFRDNKRSTTLVVTKIHALFGETAPYLFQSKNNQTLEAPEELWLNHFKIQCHMGIKASIPIKEEWEIRKGKQDFANWKTRRKAHILSFDGASKGNPGQAGGGGIIENPLEATTINFALGLGIESNNRAEALALWQGLIQAKRHRIQDLVIIGDSRVVIQALIRHSKTQSASLNNLLDKIHLLLRNFKSYKLYHVLRELNGKADVEANKGTLLAPGILKVNEMVSSVALP
jgi:ribonuclease HI